MLLSKGAAGPFRRRIPKAVQRTVKGQRRQGPGKADAASVASERLPEMFAGVQALQNDLNVPSRAAQQMDEGCGFRCRGLASRPPRLGAPGLAAQPAVGDQVSGAHGGEAIKLNVVAVQGVAEAFDGAGEGQRRCDDRFLRCLWRRLNSTSARSTERSRLAMGAGGCSLRAVLKAPRFKLVESISWARLLSWCASSTKRSMSSPSAKRCRCTTGSKT